MFRIRVPQVVKVLDMILTKETSSNMVCALVSLVLKFALATTAISQTQCTPCSLRFVIVAMLDNAEAHDTLVVDKSICKKVATT
jgi:hypothetical protein